jgi:hypothetical protein
MAAQSGNCIANMHRNIVSTFLDILHLSLIGPAIPVYVMRLQVVQALVSERP